MVRCPERRAVASSGVAVAIAGLLFAFARPALGEVRVERGDGAGACPDGAAFTTRLRGDDEGQPPITVRFERTRKGYRAVVVTGDGRQRTLADDGSSCEGLAEATLLAVRLALDLPPPTPSTTSTSAAAPPVSSRRQFSSAVGQDRRETGRSSSCNRMN